MEHRFSESTDNTDDSRDRLRESREPASGTSPDSSGGVSDNDRKYYSIDRAREALGYDPQDNSAEWDGKEHVDGER